MAVTRRRVGQENLSLTRWTGAAKINLGRARRGASGALNPQPALAGLNPPLRPSLGPMFPGRMLRSGPCAAEACESRQVRKEAAVNGPFRAPQVRLV